MLSNNLNLNAIKYLIKISKIFLVSNFLLNINLLAQTWEIINPTFSDGDSLIGKVEITFADKEHGWLIQVYEADGPIREFYKKIYKTEDGGNNWIIKKTELSEEFYIPKVYSLSSNNLIALYISQKDSSLHSIITNDNGATWELNNTDNRGIYQEFITTIYMVNDKYGIAFNNVIWQTNDGGNEWGKKNNALNLFPPPCEIFFINDSIGWIVGNSSYYATDAGFLAKTINGGESWEIIDSRTMLLYGIDFINSNIGYAVGTNWNFGTGFIYHTENAGDTWQIEQYIGAKAFWDVGFLDVKNGWITGVGKILKTIDGGVSWETQIEGLLTNLNKIQILKEEKVAYIFGDDFNNRTHTLLKADLSTISDIKNKEIISNELSLSQNYPNPFNSITSIYFNLNRNRHVQLKIYNFLGKEVTTLINEELFPGNYEIEWNGKNNQGDEVTSGIYFYSIMTDLNNEVKKMILLK